MSLTNKRCYYTHVQCPLVAVCSAVVCQLAVMPALGMFLTSQFIQNSRKSININPSIPLLPVYHPTQTHSSFFPAYHDLDLLPSIFSLAGRTNADILSFCARWVIVQGDGRPSLCELSRASGSLAACPNPLFLSLSLSAPDTCAHVAVMGHECPGNTPAFVYDRGMYYKKFN